MRTPEQKAVTFSLDPYFITLTSACSHLLIFVSFCRYVMADVAADGKQLSGAENINSNGKNRNNSVAYEFSTLPRLHLPCLFLHLFFLLSRIHGKQCSTFE